MDQDAKKIIESIYSLLSSRRELLDDNNQDIAITLICQAVNEDFNNFYKSGQLREVTPTSASVRKVFLGNVDFSQLTGDDIDEATEGLRATLAIWEKNRASLI